MIKVKQLVLAAALASAGLASHAAPLSVMTPDGLVSGITNLDWAPAPVLAIGANAAVANLLNGVAGTSQGVSGVFAPTVGHAFTVVSQGRLSEFVGGTGAGVDNLYNGTTALVPNRYEITFEFMYQEIVYSVVPDAATGEVTARFDFAQDQSAGNYFRIWVRDLDSVTPSNFADGTNFAGTAAELVFDGKITPQFSGTGSFTAQQGNIVPMGQDTDPSNGTSSLSSLNTVSGTGSQNAFDLLKVSASYIDPNFWLGDLTTFLVNNVNTELPFTIDPSELVAGYVPQVGTTSGVNGGLIFRDRIVADGNDVMFQTDFNSTVSATVPEPGTLALAGLALGGLALARRRKA